MAQAQRTPPAVVAVPGQPRSSRPSRPSRMGKRLPFRAQLHVDDHMNDPPELNDSIPPVTRAIDLSPVALSSAVWQCELVRRLVLSDGVAALIAALVALLIRFGQDAALLYELMPLIYPVLWVGVCATTRSYEHRFLGTGSEEFRRVTDAGLRVLAVAALTSFAFRLELARLFVLIAIPLSVVLSVLFRYFLRQRLHRRRKVGECLHRVIVVGRERSCAELVRQLRREPNAGFLVVGACIDTSQGPSVENVQVVGTSTTVVEALRRTGADTVAVGAWSDLTQDDLRRLSWELEGSGVDLVVAPSLVDVAGPRIHIRPVSGLPLLHIEQPEFSGGRRLLKGTVDRLTALIVLLLASPVLLGVAIAIKVNSRGPAFFLQTRVGADGKDFTIYKFRSMYSDAEDRLRDLQSQNENGDGLLFKMKNDPRVTPVGRFLRRFSIDEVPQLLNVVTGDMSLVGPRPPLPKEVEQYGDDVRRRLLVRPGLTGLWQVSGRSDLSWDESVRLDLHYVENWSLALDAMIIYKTIFAVLRRDGAY